MSHSLRFLSSQRAAAARKMDKTARTVLSDEMRDICVSTFKSLPPCTTCAMWSEEGSFVFLCNSNTAACRWAFSLKVKEECGWSSGLIVWQRLFVLSGVRLIDCVDLHITHKSHTHTIDGRGNKKETVVNNAAKDFWPDSDFRKLPVLWKRSKPLGHRDAFGLMMWVVHYFSIVLKGPVWRWHSASCFH